MRDDTSSLLSPLLFASSYLFSLSGDLRVCTYCCKVVLSYLQSTDMRSDLSADLRALQEDLRVKYGNDSPLLTPAHPSARDHTASVCRKPSVGYMEENYATARYAFLLLPPPSSLFSYLSLSLSRRSANTYLTSRERALVLRNSASLRVICDELFRSDRAIPLQTHRIRLKSYHDCFLASELVDWMIARGKAATRCVFLLNPRRLSSSPP